MVLHLFVFSLVRSVGPRAICLMHRGGQRFPERSTDLPKGAQQVEQSSVGTYVF